MIKLLIVDDEPLVQIGIKSMLNWADYGIEICGTAANGQAALSMIEDLGPELVITDIKMPIMNGLEATRIIREEGASLPIIMQTAYAFSSDRENAMQAGASEVLVKPITVSALRGCLSSYFPEIKW